MTKDIKVLSLVFKNSCGYFTVVTLADEYNEQEIISTLSRDICEICKTRHVKEDYTRFGVEYETTTIRI